MKAQFCFYKVSWKGFYYNIFNKFTLQLKSIIFYTTSTQALTHLFIERFSMKI